MATRVPVPPLAVRRLGPRRAPEPLNGDDNEDTQLVVQYLAGDPGAFTVLYNRYWRRLLHFIIRMIGDADRAEDLVQETFLRMAKHAHNFDQGKKFSTWVYTIAGNLAKNELRGRSRNPLVLYQQMVNQWSKETQQDPEWPCDKYNPSDLFRKRHLRQIVEETIARLPEHHRVVFVLREIEGMTYEEISLVTGIDLGTVKSRLSRARDNFEMMIRPLLE